MFDGGIGFIVQIIKKFLPCNFEGKAVIMVDATSVAPKVKVYEDGTVEGIIGCDKVEKSEVIEFFEKEERFLEFIGSNADKIIQAEFGITFAPLSPEYKFFPIAWIPATSGKATVEMLTKIEIFNATLRRRYDIVGLETDGDNTYHKYSSKFVSIPNLILRHSNKII